MYKIISGGTVVALCDEPRYIKVKPDTGAFVQTTENDAQGIAVNGTPYNLSGHVEITVAGETAPVAFINPVDGGYILFKDTGRITVNEDNIVELQEATCDMDVNMEEMMEALCDLDEGRE